MNDETRIKRTKQALARYGLFQLRQRSSRPQVTLALFLPGVRHPDLSFFERFFLKDLDGKLVGRTRSGEWNGVEGTWLNAARIAGSRWMADALLKEPGKLRPQDRALIESWQTVLRSMPSQAPQLDPELRAAIQRDFTNMTRRKVHRRELYPAEGIIDSDFVIASPADFDDELFEVRRYTPAKKLAHSTAETYRNLGTRKKLTTQLKACRAENAMLSASLKLNASCVAEWESRCADVLAENARLNRALNFKRGLDNPVPVG